jgi:acyl-CoA synthetase (AMP-forming)/AMP-acid ligase II/acyl carrier protein
MLLIEALQGSHEDERLLYTFLDDAGKEVEKCSYGEFKKSTQNLALLLLNNYGLKKGDRVMLVYPPGLDFITAFVACIRAGLVAVPVYPPRPGLNKDLKMFLSIQSNCGAKVCLTNSLYNFAKKIESIKSSITKLFSSNDITWPNDLKWIVTNQIISNSPKGDVGIDDSTEDTLAFLQYTSGSTSNPKGVMLTNGNLAHNLQTIIYALEASEKTVVVSWLPCYHDMGLIGSLLGILYCNGTGYYLSPVSFVKNPIIWLKSASKYKATHLQAPNFAYKLTVRKTPPNESFDLSSVRHIFNAAEPIDVNSMDSFLELFCSDRFNLNVNAMVPGYGLAEHTVYVSDGGKQRLRVNKEKLESDGIVEVLEELDNINIKENLKKENTQEIIVGCGFINRHNDNGTKLLIVDKESLKPVDEDKVGEIWVSSKSKSNGYFNMPEKSKTDLHAKLANDDGREYLRTGDLGFLHNKELFVCGRIKDLIIVRGRNHYPQDIELSIEASNPNDIKPGCSASFTVNDPETAEEVLGCVAEVRNSSKAKHQDIVANIKKKITSEHGIKPHLIVLIKERSIPKTTSGKISRYRCREGAENLTLNELFRWTDNSPEPIEDNLNEVGMDQIPIKNKSNKNDEVLDLLIDEAAALMETDIDNINPATPLVELGFDSMALTQLKGMISNEFKVEINEEDLYNEQVTLQMLVDFIKNGSFSNEADENAPLLKSTKKKNDVIPPIVCCKCIIS